MLIKFFNFITPSGYLNASDDKYAFYFERNTLFENMIIDDQELLVIPGDSYKRFIYVNEDEKELEATILTVRFDGVFSDHVYKQVMKIDVSNICSDSTILLYWDGEKIGLKRANGK